MAEQDIIQTSVSLASAQISVAGFGKPLILANNDNTTSWGSTVYREYASLAGVLADFAASTATYLQAQAIFEQSPTVPLVGIGLRTTSHTTQVFFLDLQSAAINATGTVYTFTVDGHSFSYTTTTGDDTHDTQITHLVTALTGASWYGTSGLTITADSTNGAGFHLVKILATGSAFHDIVVTTTNLNYVILYQAQGVAGTGGSSTQTLVAADLNAIANQNNTWYLILSPFTSPIEVLAIAKFADANTKAFAYQTSDTNNVTVASATNMTLASNTPAPSNPPVTATAASLFALNAVVGGVLSGVLGIYTQTLLNFTDAALAAARLWTTPGSETWAFVQLADVAVAVLTETQRNNVVGTAGAPAAVYGNVYENVGGANITEFGICRGGQYLDTIRFLAWVNANIQADLLQVLVDASAAGTKIPYTQAGITLLCGIVLARLKTGVDNGGFAAVPPPACPPPLLASISTPNLTSRNLPAIKWNAHLAGAIQTVAPVQGTVTV